MILSVVIVSYNVKFFLEQCLSSVKKAITGSDLLRKEAEVFIIDNASTDGSLDFLTPLFPSFHFIQNKENAGFAKANNQVLSSCTGEFVLFLNPDTILAEDSLDIVVSFFRSTADAGAVGVRMVDGAGHFLKESKRGFPSPLSSFFKMSGLSGLFPGSKFFSGYYVGDLSEDEIHAVDILSGAFMMVRKTILDQTDGFDEQFFMYAEDIDLSYRIRKAGFRNYYLPTTTIIHFKGESTRKDSRYIKMFYTAMELFMKKYSIGRRSTIRLMILKAGLRLHEAQAYFRLPETKLNRGKPLRVYIKGSLDDQQKWKTSLRSKKIPLSENERDAEEVIYCEGPILSWKSIIIEILKKRTGFRHKFQAAGSHAAVGSFSSSEQGAVYEF
jgi:N-acetylglucosaminyl-diphospho-decaprenol L-rhamnosyltransferase